MKQKFKRILSGLLSSVMMLGTTAGILPELTLPAAAEPITNPNPDDETGDARLVSTYEELASALEDPSVKEINVISDIKCEIQVNADLLTLKMVPLIKVKGHKTLDLRGFKIEISHNDNRYDKTGDKVWQASESTLLKIEPDATLIIDDSKHGGKIKYYNKAVMGTDEDFVEDNINWGYTENYDTVYMTIQRHLIDNYGTLVVQDGTLETGCIWDWIQEIDEIGFLSWDEYGYVRNQVSGTAIRARDGSLTIVNGGKVWGRGTSRDSIFPDPHEKNAAIAFMGNGTASVYINGGEICGKGGANVFNPCNPSDLLESVGDGDYCYKNSDLQISGGIFIPEKLERYAAPGATEYGCIESEQGILAIPDKSWKRNLGRAVVMCGDDVVNEYSDVFDEEETFFVHRTTLLKYEDLLNVSLSSVIDGVKRYEYSSEPLQRLVWNPEEDPSAPDLNILELEFKNAQFHKGMQYDPNYTITEKWSVWKGDMQGAAAYSYTRTLSGDENLTDSKNKAFESIGRITNEELVAKTGLNWNETDTWVIKYEVTETVPCYEDEYKAMKPISYLKYTQTSKAFDLYTTDLPSTAGQLWKLTGGTGDFTMEYFPGEDSYLIVDVDTASIKSALGSKLIHSSYTLDLVQNVYYYDYDDKYTVNDQQKYSYDFCADYAYIPAKIRSGDYEASLVWTMVDQNDRKVRMKETIGFAADLPNINFMCKYTLDTDDYERNGSTVEITSETIDPKSNVWALWYMVPSIRVETNKWQNQHGDWEYSEEDIPLMRGTAVWQKWNPIAGKWIDRTDEPDPAETSYKNAQDAGTYRYAYTTPEPYRMTYYSKPFTVVYKHFDAEESTVVLNENSFTMSNTDWTTEIDFQFSGEIVKGDYPYRRIEAEILSAPAGAYIASGRAISTDYNSNEFTEDGASHVLGGFIHNLHNDADDELQGSAPSNVPGKYQLRFKISYGSAKDASDLVSFYSETVDVTLTQDLDTFEVVTKNGKLSGTTATNPYRGVALGETIDLDIVPTEKYIDMSDYTVTWYIHEGGSYADIDPNTGEFTLTGTNTDPIAVLAKVEKEDGSSVTKTVYIAAPLTKYKLKVGTPEIGGDATKLISMFKENSAYYKLTVQWNSGVDNEKIIQANRPLRATVTLTPLFEYHLLGLDIEDITVDINGTVHNAAELGASFLRWWNADTGIFSNYAIQFSYDFGTLIDPYAKYITEIALEQQIPDVGATSAPEPVHSVDGLKVTSAIYKVVDGKKDKSPIGTDNPVVEDQLYVISYMFSTGLSKDHYLNGNDVKLTVNGEETEYRAIDGLTYQSGFASYYFILPSASGMGGDAAVSLAVEGLTAPAAGKVPASISDLTVIDNNTGAESEDIFVNGVIWFVDANDNGTMDKGENAETNFNADGRFKANTVYTAAVFFSDASGETDVTGWNVFCGDSGIAMTRKDITLGDEAVTMFTYKFPATAAGVPGDVNVDGDVDTTDADLLAKYFAGWPEEELGTNFNLAAADMDGDGTVSRREAMILSRKAAGWTTNIGE